MSYLKIHKALTESLTELLRLNFNETPIAHENVDFDPSGLDQFIDLTLLPAETTVISKDTLDEERGIYQMSIYTKSGVSVASAYEISDLIANHYRHGLKLTSGTDRNGVQKIFIDRTSRNGGRNAKGWFVIDLSIHYIADLER